MKIPSPTRNIHGLSLVEMLVYMGVLMLILGVGYTALYRSLDAARALQHSTADIADALHAGEDWRLDVRRAQGDIRVETNGDECILHLGRKVSYRFAGNTVFRRLGANDWSPLLPRVKSSQFLSDPRNSASPWRWELELQPRTKRVTAIRPLFTFIAVPAAETLP